MGLFTNTYQTFESFKTKVPVLSGTGCFLLFFLHCSPTGLDHSFGHYGYQYDWPSQLYSPCACDLDDGSLRFRSSSSKTINCGGYGLVDKSGNRWMSDLYYIGGRDYKNTDMGISSTLDEILLQTERWAPESVKECMR